MEWERDGGPGSFNSGLEAALSQVSNSLVLRGEWSMPLWPVSLRLEKDGGGGGDLTGENSNQWVPLKWK